MYTISEREETSGMKHKKKARSNKGVFERLQSKELGWGNTKKS
jgi:hypothetical protein